MHFDITCTRERFRLKLFLGVLHEERLHTGILSSLFPFLLPPSHLFLFFPFLHSLMHLICVLVSQNIGYWVPNIALNDIADLKSRFALVDLIWPKVSVLQKKESFV